jgi:nitrogen fixation protein FixH
MIWKTFGALAMMLVLTNASPASDAHSQHGGRAVGAGDYHVEMVVKAGVVDVYLADHDNKAVRAAGYKALAILVVDGKSQRIALTPAGESRLSGKATGELPSAPKGVVQITRPDGKTVQARFD